MPNSVVQFPADLPGSFTGGFYIHKTMADYNLLNHGTPALHVR